MQGINSSSTYNSVCLAAAGMEIVNPPFIPLVDPRRAGSEIGPTELVTVRQCIGRPNAHYTIGVATLFAGQSIYACSSCSSWGKHTALEHQCTANFDLEKSPNFVSLNQQLVKNIYFCKVESFFFLKSSRSCMICRVCLVYFGFWIFGFLEENLSHLKY